MKFMLDETVYGYAVKNPYPGCKNVENAALGRAAEAAITNLFMSRFDDGCTYVRCGPRLPPAISSDKAHDGSLFDGNKLIAVLEAKLAIQGYYKNGKPKPLSVAISAAERVTLEWCLNNNVEYILIVAEYLGNFQAQYVGAVCVDKEFSKLGDTTFGSLRFNVADIKQNLLQL